MIKNKGLLVSIAVFAYLIINIQYSYSQNAQLLWSNWFSNGSMASRDHIVKSAKAVSGNYYVSGQTEKDISQFDITTFAYSGNGDLIWRQDYSIADGMKSDNKLIDMHIDLKENVYLLGISYLNQYDVAIFVIKYDKNGKLLWERNLKNTVYYVISGITADVHGNTYLNGVGDSPLIKLDVSGKVCWEVDTEIYYTEKIFYGTDHHIYVFGNGSKGALSLSKVDTLGNLKWKKDFNIGDLKGPTKIIDIQADSNNNIYTLLNIYTEGRRFNWAQDVMLLKINTEGEFFWGESYDGGYKNFDESCNLKLVDDSLIFIGGHTMTDSSLLDIFILEYNSVGILKDSFKYNSIYNQSDYLFSFDIDTNNNKYLTSVTFVNDYQFFTNIIKLNKDNQVEWEKPALSSFSDRIYPEKCFLNSKEDELIVIGNLRSTVNPMLSWDTNSDYWIMRMDSSGNEKNDIVYTEAGTSFLNEGHITIDSEKNIYLSGKSRLGPSYEVPNHFYIQDYFLNKVDSIGQNIWSISIDIDSYDEYNFLGHYNLNDSVIFLIGNLLKGDQKFILIQKYNNEGILINEVIHENDNSFIDDVIVASDGSIYVFELRYSEYPSKLRKFNADLEFEWKLIISEFFQLFAMMDFDKENNLLLMNREGIIIKISETGKKLGTYYVPHKGGLNDMKVDDQGNIYTIGYGSASISAQACKLNSDGGLIWEYESSIYMGMKIIPKANGETVLFGPTCNVGGCRPSRVTVLNSEGYPIKMARYDVSIRGALIDSSGNIYINANDHVLKLSDNLEILSKYTYINDTLNIGYTIDDFLIDDTNNVYTTGVAGNMTTLHYSFWEALFTTKIDMGNTNPVFTTFHSKINMPLTDNLNIQYTAVDYDKDQIYYSSSSLPDFLKLDSITGVLSGKLNEYDEGDFAFQISATDIHGGSIQQKVILRVGNSAPKIMDISDDSIKIKASYSFKPHTIDNEFDFLTYQLTPKVEWIYSNPYDGSFFVIPNLMKIGVYDMRLQVRDEFGGTDYQDFTLTIYDENATSIEEYSSLLSETNQKDILVYPNPFSNNFHVKFNDEDLANLKISLQTLDGGIISYSRHANSLGIWDSGDLSNIKPGIYILHIESNTRSFQQKVIKIE